jgi:hypothetical protein
MRKHVLRNHPVEVAQFEAKFGKRRRLKNLLLENEMNNQIQQIQQSNTSILSHNNSMLNSSMSSSSTLNNSSLNNSMINNSMLHNSPIINSSTIINNSLSNTSLNENLIERKYQIHQNPHHQQPVSSLSENLIERKYQQQPV